jgi:hypothetical protein
MEDPPSFDEACRWALACRRRRSLVVLRGFWAFGEEEQSFFWVLWQRVLCCRGLCHSSSPPHPNCLWAMKHELYRRWVQTLGPHAHVAMKRVLLREKHFTTRAAACFHVTKFVTFTTRFGGTRSCFSRNGLGESRRARRGDSRASPTRLGESGV